MRALCDFVDVKCSCSGSASDQPLANGKTTDGEARRGFDFRSAGAGARLRLSAAAPISIE